jgi:thiol:disulfide interchange protein DsbD
MFTAFRLHLTALILLLAFVPSGAFQQEVLTVKVYGSADRVPAGIDFLIALVVEIDPPWHINSNKPLEDIYRATRVSYKPLDMVSFGKVYYPEGEVKSFDFSETGLSVYEKQITVFTEVTIANSMEPTSLLLEGVLDYQACNDQICLFPSQEHFSIPIEVVGPNETISLAHQEIFAKFSEKDKPAADEAWQLTRQERQAKEVLEKGFVYAIAAFFIFGLALNLTPCVYPVIPITVSYFGGQSGEQREAGFFRALVYVIGIAIVFSVLGLISGLAGKQWGFLFQNPWFVMGVTVIILAMAASMFGAFEIRVPSALMNKFGHSREGVIGALIMGLTVGVVIAPCAAGIIIGLVGLVAKLGIAIKGGILFFIMGLGLGLPYLLLASFSGLLNQLPQSGVWLVWVKKIFGVLLVGVALYFFLPQAEHLPDMQGFFLGLLAIFGGLLLGFLDHSTEHTNIFKKVRWVSGAAIILFGIYLTHGAIQVKTKDLEWHHYSNEALQTLLVDGKPVFIDFYADWCAPCHEMDRKTFADDQVIDNASKFKMVKVDCTTPDEPIRTFMEQFQVTGMPTLVFLDRRGNELTHLREVGYIGPDRILDYMDQVLSLDAMN